MKFPFLSAVNVKYLNQDEIKEVLVKQITSPVLWLNCVKRMIKDGVNCFIEVGPKNILSRLVSRMNSEVKALNVEDIKSLERVLKEMR